MRAAHKNIQPAPQWHSRFIMILLKWFITILLKWFIMIIINHFRRIVINLEHHWQCRLYIFSLWYPYTVAHVQPITTFIIVLLVSQHWNSTNWYLPPISTTLNQKEAIRKKFKMGSKRRSKRGFKRGFKKGLQSGIQKRLENSEVTKWYFNSKNNW